MAQFGSSFDEFTKTGSAVVFIAAQKIEGIFRGKGFVEKHQYPFPLLFDETREITKKYGVYQRAGVDAINIARRAMFLIDRDGKIQWIAVSPHQWEAPKMGEIVDAIEACEKC